MGREARSKRWWLSHRVVWLLLMGFVFGVVTAAVVVIQWRIAAARGEAFDLLVAVGWAAAVGAIVALSIGLFGFVVIVGAVEPEERFSFRSWGSGEGGGEGSESHATRAACAIPFPMSCWCRGTEAMTCGFQWRCGGGCWRRWSVGSRSPPSPADSRSANAGCTS